MVPAEQMAVIFDNTFTFASAGNMTTSLIQVEGYRNLKIVFWQVAQTGSPNLQADIQAILADGSIIDYYNNGTHAYTFSYDLGPGASQGLPWNQFKLLLALTGATVTATYRVVVVGIV